MLSRLFSSLRICKWPCLFFKIVGKSIKNRGMQILSKRYKNNNVEYLVQEKSEDPFNLKWTIVEDQALLRKFNHNFKDQAVYSDVKKTNQLPSSIPNHKPVQNAQIQPSKDLELFLKIISFAKGPSIEVINDIDNSVPAADFVYIDHVIYGNEIPKPSDDFLTGCDCKDECNPITCDCIIHGNEGHIPYDKRRRLIDIDRRPIVECNLKCKCSSNCPLKVVQKGRQVKINLRKTTDGRGWGVVSGEKIAIGTFICSYIGEIITLKESGRRNLKYIKNNQDNHYFFDLDIGQEGAHAASTVMSGKSNKSLKSVLSIVDESEEEIDLASSEDEQEDRSYFTIDATRYGNIGRFINHSCAPNLLIKCVFVESQDSRLHYITFFAARDLLAGEELTADYMGLRGEKGWEEKAKTEKFTKRTSAVPQMKCLCGHTYCRGYVYV